ncbi:MAG: sulfate adenylyltransferase subunit 2 [Spirochaetaceae bacterium]|nr:MAG: sulfate adenylyltransferase subunit 2 [Spirochaetaceae bacterium]
MSYRLSHLDELEAEAIYVIRDAYAQLERPVLLFSGGKDSIVMATLAARAFHPGPIPFPFLHIDTGHNFAETIAFRDRFCGSDGLGVRLIVRTVEESIRIGRVHEPVQVPGRPGAVSRNALQTVTLLDAIGEFSFDGALGGARRDEEKARAKERFFSFRDNHGQWDPRNQRPELWMTFNARKNPGETIRVFPLSNWTELDIWRYIERERIDLPSLYFSHRRPTIVRDGVILAVGDAVVPAPGEQVVERSVRFRTIGDTTCTGASESDGVATVADIVREIRATRSSERGSRADDRTSDASMEERKRQGYF